MVQLVPVADITSSGEPNIANAIDLVERGRTSYCARADSQGRVSFKDLRIPRVTGDFTTPFGDVVRGP
jgi:hypothetical protein